MNLPFWIRIRLKYFSKRISIKVREFSDNVKAVPIIEKEDRGNVIVRDHLGIRLKLQLNNYIDSQIFHTGYFERKSSIFVEKFVKKGMVCLDVGANFGYYALKMAALVQNSGKVYAFEPSNKFFNRLTENLKLNDCSNIIVENIGLSDKPAEASLSVGDQTASIHWYPKINEMNLKVDQISLIDFDSYFTDNLLKRLDFIKVDIDGHEYKFLRGAENSIKKYLPVILLEVDHLSYRKAGVDIEEFYGYLTESLGYKIFDESKKEIKDLTDFLIIAGNYAFSTNIICSKNMLN